MDEERMELILESLCRAEKILSTKTKVCDIECLCLSRNITMKAYDLADFREIREAEGIRALDKLGRRYIVNNKFFGKSGSLLFFTEDFRFAVKTIRANELRCMRKMIAGYKAHLLANPRSFLCRILGCYSITDGETSDCFIIMKNILKSPRIGEIYDLKGAFVKRRGDSSLNLKDMDWANSNRSVKLHEDKKEVMAQIREDVELLRRHRIMDYSLLICFPSKKKSHDFCLTSSKGVCNLKLEQGEEQEHVYFGIIDILTQWTVPKMLERFLNALCCRTNSSCVNPDAYVDRFLTMMESGFFK